MTNRLRIKATVKSINIKRNESTVQLVLDKWEVDKVPALSEFAGCEVYVDIEATQEMLDFEDEEM